jgi:cytochrome bd-type quinol oxidase subunit 2
MDISYTHRFKKIFLSSIVFIMIMMGIFLLITGNKAQDDSFGCLLIIAGFMLYYLVSCLVLNPNVYQSIDMDDANEFDL